VEHKVATADVAEKFNEKFLELLETVSASRAELIRRMLRGVSLRRIAAVDGISLMEARNQFSATLSQLRHPSRAGLLRAYDLDDDDFAQFFRLLAEAAEADDGSLMWCEFHGWTELHGMPQCPACNCELPIPENPFLDLDFGRPRSYCSNACRQRAYRRRQKAEAVGDQ
jgi:hypothetical protein